jgi:hypothetical protein
MFLKSAPRLCDLCVLLWLIGFAVQGPSPRSSPRKQHGARMGGNSRVSLPRLLQIRLSHPCKSVSSVVKIGAGEVAIRGSAVERVLTHGRQRCGQDARGPRGGDSRADSRRLLRDLASLIRGNLCHPWLKFGGFLASVIWLCVLCVLLRLIVSAGACRAPLLGPLPANSTGRGWGSGGATGANGKWQRTNDKGGMPAVPGGSLIRREALCFLCYLLFKSGVSRADSRRLLRGEVCYAPMCCLRASQMRRLQVSNRAASRPSISRRALGSVPE